MRITKKLSTHDKLLEQSRRLDQLRQELKLRNRTVSDEKKAMRELQGYRRGGR